MAVGVVVVIGVRETIVRLKVVGRFTRCLCWMVLLWRVQSTERRVERWLARHLVARQLWCRITSWIQGYIFRPEVKKTPPPQKKEQEKYSLFYRSKFTSSLPTCFKISCNFRKIAGICILCLDMFGSVSSFPSVCSMPRYFPLVLFPPRASSRSQPPLGLFSFAYRA